MYVLIVERGSKITNIIGPFEQLADAEFAYRTIVTDCVCTVHPINGYEGLESKYPEK